MSDDDLRPPWPFPKCLTHVKGSVSMFLLIEYCKHNAPSIQDKGKGHAWNKKLPVPEGNRRWRQQETFRRISQPLMPMPSSTI